MKTSKKVSFAKTPQVMNNNVPQQNTGIVVKSVFSLSIALFLLAINIVILVYLQRLNHDDCKTCFRDSRHNIVKGLAIYNLVSIIGLPLLYLLFKNNVYSRIIMLLIMIVNLVLSGWMAISFTTYIYKLESTGCECLENEKLKGLHKFLSVWRYFMLFGFLTGCLGLIVMLAFVMYRAITNQ